MFNRLKATIVILTAVLMTGASIAFAWLRAIAKRKEYKALGRSLENYKTYTKLKERIRDETEAKINHLSGDTADSFDAGIELLHEAANPDD